MDQKIVYVKALKMYTYLDWSASSILSTHLNPIPERGHWGGGWCHVQLMLSEEYLDQEVGMEEETCDPIQATMEPSQPGPATNTLVFLDSILPEDLLEGPRTAFTHQPSSANPNQPLHYMPHLCPSTGTGTSSCKPYPD